MNSKPNPMSMKTKSANRLVRAASLAACLAWPLLVSSCQTTGDPSTGGIFWSERKAQDRLNERQAKLQQVDEQTADAKKKAKAKQAEASKLQQQ